MKTLVEASKGSQCGKACGSLLVRGSVHGGPAAGGRGARRGRGRADEAAAEAVHAPPRQEDPRPHGGGRPRRHGQGLQELEDISQEGTQTSTVLSDQTSANCGDVINDRIKTTFLRYITTTKYLLLNCIAACLYSFDLIDI